MKFKIDENLPMEIRDDLRAAGHDIESLGDAVYVAVVMVALLGAHLYPSTGYFSIINS